MPKKSKGHIKFYWYGKTQYELYLDDKGDLWRAPCLNVIDLDTGNRIGRWEAPSHLADEFIKRFK